MVGTPTRTRTSVNGFGDRSNSHYTMGVSSNSATVIASKSGAVGPSLRRLLSLGVIVATTVTPYFQWRHNTAHTYPVLRSVAVGRYLTIKTLGTSPEPPCFYPGQTCLGGMENALGLSSI